jgi:DNA-binding MarR family transcriptional regulator
MDNIYEMNGYASRNEYLTDLADNMGLDRSIVSALADMLGENEDFDGLVTSLEDISCEDFDY